MTTTLVTGATGFIGHRLVTVLLEQGSRVIALARNTAHACQIFPAGAIEVRAADFDQPVSLTGICQGVDSVFHLAGFAHAVDVDDTQARQQHERVTVEGTRALLREAARAGIRRFVFASSVKAMGEGGSECLDELTTPHPTSAYGRAKRTAEELVLEAGKRHGWHVAILRFPLVYGPGNRGNLPRLIEAIDHGRFPPLPPVRNRRSMVHVDDAVSALLLVAEQPRANGQIYLVTDGQSYSTGEMYRLIRRTLSKSEPAWHIPMFVLRLGARLGDLAGFFLGRPFIFDSTVLTKLSGSAWYSDEKICRELGYRSRHTLASALPEMVEEYRRRRGEAAAVSSV